MKQIVADRFCKRYGNVTAVRDLSFSVDSGQILGLVGHNGAGKTSTLNALAAISAPTSGRVLIAGHDTQQDPLNAKRQIGYVPDNPTLFGTLTVWEHLSFVAATYGVQDFEETAESLLCQFQVEQKRNEMTQNLSRGMQQKISVICAYLHNPRVLVFDEPLTGLDPSGIRVLADSIRQRAQQGVAIVVSSHLLRLVQDMCTHLALLHNGELVASGLLSGVMEQFKDLAAAPSLEDVYFAITKEKP